MPDLHLLLSERVRASVTQNFRGRDAHVTIEWYEDGVLNEVHSEWVTDETLVANVWDTLHFGTTWHFPVVERLIEHVMPKAFEKYWREMLKGMGKHEIIARTIHKGIDTHLTINANGGMDSWLVKDSVAYHMGHHHTIDDIVRYMQTVHPKIDGWVKVAKGDIYPSMDDDDTQELEIVGGDDETVPGEVSEVVDTDSLDKFEVFVVPRLSKMKDMVSLVLIGDLGDERELHVWFDGRIWHSRYKYQEDEFSLHLTHDYMVGAVIAMYKACPSMDKWKLRQLTMNGLFDTIHTQEWNKTDGAE